MNTIFTIGCICIVLAFILTVAFVFWSLTIIASCDSGADILDIEEEPERPISSISRNRADQN